MCARSLVRCGLSDAVAGEHGMLGTSYAGDVLLQVMSVAVGHQHYCYSGSYFEFVGLAAFVSGFVVIFAGLLAVFDYYIS
jgi:hypothetical protein